MNRNFLPLEELVKIEKLTTNVVMNIEEKRLANKYGYKNKGKVWDLLDVSLHEHYDIKVIENGEEKYIGVKGHNRLFQLQNLQKQNINLLWKMKINIIYISSVTLEKMKKCNSI